MEQIKYIKPERIALARDPVLNERWVQERIADDPSLLGLGDLILKDQERRQPKAGDWTFSCKIKTATNGMR